MLRAMKATLAAFIRRAGATAGLAAFAASLSPATAEAQLIRDTEIEATLQRLSAPIFRAAGVPIDTVPFYIIRNDDLNAFVAAGGRSLFLHTGLLRRLETPEELLGVVAHEVGHITGGHVVSRIDAVRNARVQSYLALLLGLGVGVASRDGGGGVGAAGAAQQIIQRELLRFSRGQEASADQAAIDYLNRAGIDPSGMLRVLERIAEEQAIFIGQVDPYALTHPLSRRRIELLSERVAASPALGAQLPEEVRYWHARMRAKLDGFLGRLGGAEVDYGSDELRLYARAITLHRIPDPDRAIEAIDQLIRLRPNDPFYWELKGQILFESGRGAEAVEPYRRATELSREAPLIAAGLGEALLTLETPEATAEALRVLERAALAEPLGARMRRALAIAYARNGDEGMAALVTAERMVLFGRVRDAQAQATRAQRLLPAGSPGWLRAEDILTLRGR